MRDKNPGQVIFFFSAKPRHSPETVHRENTAYIHRKVRVYRPGTPSRTVAGASAGSGRRGDRARDRGLHGAVADYGRRRHRVYRALVTGARGPGELEGRCHRRGYGLWPGSAHAGAGKQGDHDQDGDGERGNRCFLIRKHMHEVARNGQ